MSERQAKKIRKANPVEVNAKRKKTKSEILMNSIIVVLVIAVLGLGSWAVYSKYAADNAAVQTESDVVTDDTQATQPTTIAQVAEQEGKTTEEFLAEYGLDTREDITGETDISVATEFMTLANYAKLSGIDTAQFREMNGMDESFTDDMTMGEIAEIMQAAAEEQASEEAVSTEETTEETVEDAQTEE